MISRIAPALRSVGFQVSQNSKSHGGISLCKSRIARFFSASTASVSQPKPAPAKMSSKEINFSWTESADVYFRPFGPSFVLLPLPPTNEKHKILLTDQMNVEHLVQYIVYKVPQSVITITDLDTGK